MRGSDMFRIRASCFGMLNYGLSLRISGAGFYGLGLTSGQ